jgi:hypothetical protein
MARTKQPSPEERYAEIVEALGEDPGVTRGAGKKGFGSAALCVRGKIFALLSSKARFVVKLPRHRVEELLAAGKGDRFDPGHGRRMKEWLEVGEGLEREWLPLAREALQFVASGGKT